MATWIGRVLAVIGALAGFGCVAFAIQRAATAPLIVPRAAHASTDDVAAAARRLAAQEPAWWAAAEREFPGDRWSQADHFHNLEQLAIRRDAARLGVPIDHMVVAVDRELRQNPDERRAGTAPCKPRPFYQ